MGPTRFPYGQARGFVNHFQYRGTTAGDISGSATPNVTTGDLFYANNTGALTITNFLLDDTANRAVNYEGKVIRIFFLDTATQIDNTAPLFLQGTDNLSVGGGGGNSYIELMQSRGTWYETARSKPNRSEVVASFNINANSSASVDGVRVIMLNNTGATTTSLIAFSGGQVGQEVSVMQVGSNATRIIAGGNIFMAVSNAVLINASAVYKVVKFNATTWRMLQINSAGLA